MTDLLSTLNQTVYQSDANGVCLKVVKILVPDKLIVEENISHSDIHILYIVR